MTLEMDFDRAWDYENGFYLTCDVTRIAKILAQHELFRMVAGLPGAIVECGVFKGASLARFAMFRDLHGNAHSKKLIGFDTFGKFPEARFEADAPAREDFVRQAGEESIGVEELEKALRRKGVERNIELVVGDITETVPAYAEAHPELRISLINLDTDIYEPAVTILEHLYPRLVPGGLLILDDYGTFPGETRAVEEYFEGQAMIEKLPFAMTPCYIRKPTPTSR